MKQQHEEPLEVFLLTVPQAAQAMGLGCSKVRQLIYYEGLPIVRFGRAVRIDPVQLRSWLNQRQEHDVSDRSDLTVQEYKPPA